MREFEIGKIYHICNRGVDKRKVFLEAKDYFRFLQSMRELNTPKVVGSLYRLNQLRRKESRKKEKEETKKKEGVKLLRFGTNRRSLTPSTALVEIICYCLNPNHYHLLLKQITESGISKFMQKLGTAYTNYFNSKYNRSGSLFQGTYKAIEIKTQAQLWYASAYINGNAEVHNITKAKDWPWSSYPEYLGKRNGTLPNKKFVLVDFKDINDYNDYVKEVITNAKEIKEEIRKCLIE